MICVEDVKIVQVNNSSFELGSMDKQGGAHKESIHGRIFRNSRGEDICIGMTREVQITIGLPFEAFESQNKQIEDLSREVGRNRAQLVLSSLQLSIYEGAGFFQRLKYLFTGVMQEKRDDRRQSIKK